ncbi:fungal-specific transcription factor domain-containing protein [Xylaria bambusicola]|uniref:fungal-specific transcription factor domain-containing protein n=1 Tax=Xylaria bambusicola TaxID=326684 RepID=UPI002007F3EC|nr:fungal-specific transcription factor domain-containing protein [Xylaria bambusicola]KAI0506853.1 fungal-specific transcription factor domain-containing protein [Xylaria bambusicola]
MTPTPPSAATSSSGHSPEEQFRVVRRRNRVPLSCYPCRTRKLKCNRGAPSCENCVKRGDTQSCVYATPSSRRKNQTNAGADATPDDMQNRIDRLEGLVLSLMHGGANIDAPTAAAAAEATSARNASLSNADSASSARLDRDNEEMTADVDEEASDVDENLAESLGVLKVDADLGKSMYVGQEHWHTLLADVTEVKNFYASHKKDLENSYRRVMSSKPPTARNSPIFLLSAPPSSEVELRAELPPKTAITTLVSRYFNSLDTAASIIHGPTFQQQLRAHWQDPSKSSIMWIGLLYSMLCLAMLSYHKVGDEPPEWQGRSLDLAAEYRLRTVQCLVEADYTKPVEYTVETMLLYLFGEYSSRWDADLGLWLITSLITRIAFRMGYHRDAEWFPSISPFQGEMRRRTWALLRMADIMFSYQVSLPTMIYEHDTDTKLPHNIFDEEFGVNTKSLPPSRPVTEPTPIAYMIGKSRLSFQFGNILQAVTRVGKLVPYDEILQHDRKLREIMDEFPPHLKVQPLDGSHDPVTLIIARYNLDLLFQKIMCMLHRKHISRARQNPRYAHSRRSAIEAALGTLNHLKSIYRECQPNGRLRTMKWYVSSTSRDTLLPTMMVIMELHHDHMANAAGKRQNSHAAYFWTPEQRQEMIQTLEDVREIWSKLSQESVEAYKAWNILNIMLEKIKNPEPAPTNTADAAANRAENLFGNFNSDNVQPEHTAAAMTLGMLSGSTPASTFQSPGGTNYPNLDLGANMGLGSLPDFQPDLGAINNAASPFSMFTNLGSANNMAIDQNFDWDVLDNYAQTASWTDQSFGFFAGNPEQQSQQESSTDGPFAFINPRTSGP